jgi:pre-rRNA-processing protein IPI3
VQPAANARWVSTIQQIGGVQSLDLSYDGTNLLSAHSSGKIVLWDVGRGKFVKELVDLSIQITNLFVLPPAGVSDRIEQKLKTLAVVKPKYEAAFRTSGHDIGDGAVPGSYSFTAQFSNSLKPVSGNGSHSISSSVIHTAINQVGLPERLLESAMMEFEMRPDQTTPRDAIAAPTMSEIGGSKSIDPQGDNIDGSPDREAQNDDAELWELVKRLRSVQKRTWEKYSVANLERIDLREQLKMKEKELQLAKGQPEHDLELDTSIKEMDQRMIRPLDEEIDSSEDSSRGL